MFEKFQIIMHNLQFKNCKLWLRCNICCLRSSGFYLPSTFKISASWNLPCHLPDYKTVWSFRFGVLFLRLDWSQDIFNSCNRNFSSYRAACSTCFNEPKMSPFILRKDSVNGGWNLPKGKNCTRKICIWRVDLAFSLFRKALLKNCLKQWTTSAWQLLDIYSM